MSSRCSSRWSKRGTAVILEKLDGKDLDLQKVRQLTEEMDDVAPRRKAEWLHRLQQEGEL